MWGTHLSETPQFSLPQIIIRSTLRIKNAVVPEKVETAVDH